MPHSITRHGIVALGVEATLESVLVFSPEMARRLVGILIDITAMMVALIGFHAKVQANQRIVAGLVAVAAVVGGSAASLSLSVGNGDQTGKGH